MKTMTDNDVKQLIDGQLRRPPPFAWYDHFNDCLYHNAGAAEYAARGGNRVTPMYLEPLYSNFADVQRFHTKFGIDAAVPAVPSYLAAELVRYRLGFLLEELGETAAAMGARLLGKRLQVLAVEARTISDSELAGERDLVKSFDGLLDLVVVALGTADLMGLPWEAGWDIIMARNMAKRRAAADGSDSKRNSRFDIVKPEGWYGPEPELAALLRSKGGAP